MEILNHEGILDLTDKLSNNPNVTYVTRTLVEYEYFSKYHSNLKMYDSNDVLDIKYLKRSPSNEVLFIDDSTNLNRILSDIHNGNGKVYDTIYYANRTNCAFHYHSDITKYEALCDMYGIEFIRIPVILINSVIEYESKRNRNWRSY